MRVPSRRGRRTRSRACGGERVVERRGRSPNAVRNFDVVDDPAVGELVERVEVLAHRRLEQPEEAERGAPAAMQAGSVTGEAVDVVDDLPGRPGLGDGRCHTDPVALGCEAEGDERARRRRACTSSCAAGRGCPSPAPCARSAPCRTRSRPARTGWRPGRSSPTRGRWRPRRRRLVGGEQLVGHRGPGRGLARRSAAPASSRRGPGRRSGRRRRGCRARRGERRRRGPRRARPAAAAGTPRPSGRSARR